MKHSLPPSYFESVYNNNEDPWNYETSDYEKEKYETTITALPKQHYETALELGCSIGVLTKMLSERCAKLLSIDVNEVALRKAKERLKNSPKVEFKTLAVPKEFPNDSFDLIVMSEVGYYLSMDDLKTTREKIISSLKNRGDLILVHWLPFVPDYPLTGDEVHDLFVEPTPLLQHIHGVKKEKYRLDVYTKIMD